MSKLDSNKLDKGLKGIESGGFCGDVLGEMTNFSSKSIDLVGIHEEIHEENKDGEKILILNGAKENIIFQLGNMYLTLNLDTNKYSAFSLQGKKYICIIEDILEYDTTNINNLFEIKRENEKGYLFFGKDGKIVYINFLDGNKIGNIFYFLDKEKIIFINKQGEKDELKISYEKNYSYPLIKTTSNGRNFLVVYLNLFIPNNKILLYDIDNMKVLIEAQEGTIKFDLDNNLIFFIKEVENFIRIFGKKIKLGEKIIKQTFNFSE